MFGIGFVCLLVGGLSFVCFLWNLCWALGLSVCWLGDLNLVMVGLLEQAQLINCFWNIW